MQKEIISGGQLISIMFWTIMGTAIFTLPIVINKYAPISAWMTAVIFTIGGVLLCLIIGALAKIFSDKNFVKCLESVFGLWIGKILITIFLIWHFHTITLVIWQITNFTKTSLLPKTPLLISLLIFIIPSIYAVYGGIERIARSGQLIFTFSFGILLFLFFIYIPEVNIENLLPLFDEGIYNIVRASITPLAYGGEIMFILFLVPNIKHKNKVTKYSVITILLIGIGGLINEFTYTTVFGYLRQHLSSPFYTLVRYINPNYFIERYDILFVSVNLTANFIKLSVFIYILVFGLSQLLGMKNYRPLVLPVSIGLVVATFFTVESQPQFVNFLINVYPFYTIPLLYGLPLLTLLVAKIRKL